MHIHVITLVVGNHRTLAPISTTTSFAFPTMQAAVHCARAPLSQAHASARWQYLCH